MGRLKNILFLSASLLVSIGLYAANDTIVRLQLHKSIPGNFSNFYVDNMENFYVLSNAGQQVKKLDANGDSVALLNLARMYGDIYSLDVSNPLSILVYYKDFGTVVALDRFLNVWKTIDLRNAGINQAKAVALSYDNNLWVYDQLEQKIKKIDNNGNVLLASNDLRLQFSEAPNPSQIIDNNGMLYLYDEAEGWYVFDYYGAFKKRIAFPNCKDVCIVDNKLIGRDSNNFYIKAPTGFSYRSFSIDVPMKEVIRFRQNGNRMYLLKQDGLFIYDIVQPIDN
ncbi:MAG: hypothetical protein LBE82_06925 [Chitinophagaceae bacterium]|jgi:hypothetical protein|nr:hypothetical protein [Chitinophagaceae bacterium]